MKIMKVITISNDSWEKLTILKRKLMKKNFDELIKDFISISGDGIFEERIEKLINEKLKFQPFDMPYISGLIDGEGTITIEIQNTRRKFNIPYTYPSIYITNSNKDVLAYIKNIIGGSLFKFKANSTITEQGIGSFIGSKKICYDIRIRGYNAVELASHILPYLHIKNKQAELVINFKNLLKGSGSKLSEIEYKKRYDLYCEMKKLNGRDINQNSIM